MEGTSKALLKTTLAVFLPAPAKDIMPSIVFGTSPLNSSVNCLHIKRMCLALFLYKPICLILSSSSFCVNRRKSFTVGYSLNKSLVTSLTFLSVVCADKIVATSN